APLAAALARPFGRRHPGRDRGPAPRARPLRRMRSRWVRVAATLAVTALAGGYIFWKIDVRKTIHIIGSASVGWLALSAFLILITVAPMTWRWQWLLRARGIDDGFWWLTRTYFVSYAVGQVLPTSV